MNSIDEMTVGELEAELAGIFGEDALICISRIESAWHLVENAREAGFSPAVSWDDADGLGPGYWICWLTLYGEEEKDFVEYSGTGQTAPEAICRAWLKWRRNER